jgi:hypothetical protein
MKKQLSDEQMDELLRTLVNDAAPGDGAVNEIADSPTLWWAVQRQIGRQKEETGNPWPPVGKVWRWVIIGMPAAALLLFTFLVFRTVDKPTTVGVGALRTQPDVTTGQPQTAPVLQGPAPNIATTPEVASTDRTERTVDKSTVPAQLAQSRPHSTRTKALTANVRRSSGVKTEFIALSYARNPESGQIVRVRVPSSMMVTLGLVASVEKPSDLVDAEVIVGDDGLTRAIRFIR